MAVNAFFTFFKMFQYLALFPKLTMLFRACARRTRREASLPMSAAWSP